MTGVNGSKWLTCPVCGERYPAGQGHICLDAFTSRFTAESYWTCSVCGERVPEGELHVCQERTDLLHPKFLSILEERRVLALERIAEALERLARGDD